MGIADHAESGASPPSAGHHAEDRKATLKTHRQDLANLIKIWYAYTRAGQADYFQQELWDHKGKWQLVWNKFRQDIIVYPNYLYPSMPGLPLP